MNDPTPFKAVMFDMDGTLIDSREAILATYHEVTEPILGRKEPSAPEFIEEILQLSGKHSFGRLADGDEEAEARIRAAFGEAYPKRASQIPLFPKTQSMVQRLKEEGLKLGIATSKVRQRTEFDLERNGVIEYFDSIVTSDDVDEPKPHPEPILKGMEELGVAPEELLYVGDGPNDVRAARGAGARVAGARFGFHPSELEAEGPDYLIGDWDELVEIVVGGRSA